MTPDDPAIQTLPPAVRARNGLPDRKDVAAGDRAATLVSQALGTLLQPHGLRFSPLGAGWSGDLDAHVRTVPEAAVLRDVGWLSLDGLLGRLGGRTSGRWAVIQDGAVLASIDLTTEPVPEPVAQLIKRCRTRGEIRLREMLELCALHRSGAALPDDEVVRIAADLESTLGGTDLVAWRTGRQRQSPGRLPRWRERSARRFLGRTLARRRYVLRIDARDRDLRSATAQVLVDQLSRCGVPATFVRWPGARASPRQTIAHAARTRWARGVVVYDGEPSLQAEGRVRPAGAALEEVSRLFLRGPHARLQVGEEHLSVQAAAFQLLSALLTGP